MTKPTCTIDGCTDQPYGRGWCLFHYQRWHRTGTPHRLCKGCGNHLPENVRGYCSKACKPLCAIEGCGKPESAKGWCKTHYERNRIHGTPHVRPVKCVTCGGMFSVAIDQFNAKYCSDSCRPRCVYETCGQPASGHGFCKKHLRRFRTHGDPSIVNRTPWASEWVCRFCGGEVEKGSGRRAHCSSRCQQRDHRARNGVTFERSRACALCGTEIDLFKGSAPNRKRRADVVFCESCKGRDRRPSRRHLEDLLYRDFLICGICDEPVDPDITWPHRQSVTVDHIIPVAHGGSDDIENLQLAHLACNATKQDRVGFKIA